MNIFKKTAAEYAAVFFSSLNYGKMRFYSSFIIRYYTVCFSTFFEH